jgi:hypothetical protein
MKNKFLKPNGIILIVFSIIIALLTQFPNVNKGVLGYLNYLTWIVTIVVILIIERKIIVSSTIKELLIIGIGGAFFEVLLLSTGMIIEMSKYVSLVFIPIIVYFVSFSLARRSRRDKELKILLITYCAMVVLMAMMISQNMFTNFSGWLSSKTYLYSGSTHKNSTGEILGCAILVFISWPAKKSGKKILIKSACLMVLSLALLYVQSRAVIVAVAVALIMSYIILGDVKKPFFWAIILLMIIVGIINAEKIINVFRHAFLLDKYMLGGALDLTQFSSNRFSLWKYYISEFIKSPLVGVGDAYCDNLYICSLANGGIIFGGTIIAVFIRRMMRNIRILKKSNQLGLDDYIKRLFLTSTIYFITIPFFEAYPPFGPGVACMLFWILCGYIDGIDSVKQIVVKTDN